VTTLRRVVANGGWWLLERAGALLLTWSPASWVRALGPAQYGELSYLLAITGCSHRWRSSASAASWRVPCSNGPRTSERCCGPPCNSGWRVVRSLRRRRRVLARPGASPSRSLDAARAARSQFATVTQVVEFWFQVQFKAARLVPWRTVPPWPRRSSRWRSR